MMNLYVKALAVPVLALGLACSTSGSNRTRTARSGQVILDTGLGRRIMAEPDGEPLPRIC